MLRQTICYLSQNYFLCFQHWLVAFSKHLALAINYLAKLLSILVSSSATISPITPPNAPDWQSPAFATPTAQPSKACDAL